MVILDGNLRASEGLPTGRDRTSIRRVGSIELYFRVGPVAEGFIARLSTAAQAIDIFRTPISFFLPVERFAVL